jgi:hypothetical protein
MPLLIHFDWYNHFNGVTSHYNQNENTIAFFNFEDLLGISAFMKKLLYNLLEFAIKCVLTIARLKAHSRFF